MPTDPTVHGLIYGRPLCGFSATVPAEWPAGHMWGRIDDESVKDINCPDCKKLVPEWQAKLKGNS